MEQKKATTYEELLADAQAKGYPVIPKNELKSLELFLFDLSNTPNPLSIDALARLQKMVCARILDIVEAGLNRKPTAFEKYDLLCLDAVRCGIVRTMDFMANDETMPENVICRSHNSDIIKGIRPTTLLEMLTPIQWYFRYFPKTSAAFKEAEKLFKLQEIDSSYFLQKADLEDLVHRVKNTLHEQEEEMKAKINLPKYPPKLVRTDNRASDDEVSTESESEDEEEGQPALRPAPHPPIKRTYRGVPIPSFSMVLRSRKPVKYC